MTELAKPFDLTQVRLLDGPFKDAMLRDQRFLLQIEPDRLLHMFRVTAGLPSSAEPVGGWEAPDSELRCHFLGHYLSACALMYASTADERFNQRGDRIGAALAGARTLCPRRATIQAFCRPTLKNSSTGSTGAFRSGRRTTRCTKFWPGWSMPASTAAMPRRCMCWKS